MAVTKHITSVTETAPATCDSFPLCVSSYPPLVLLFECRAYKHKMFPHVFTHIQTNSAGHSFSFFPGDFSDYPIYIDLFCSSLNSWLFMLFPEVAYLLLSIIISISSLFDLFHVLSSSAWKFCIFWRQRQCYQFFFSFPLFPIIFTICPSRSG